MSSLRRESTRATRWLTLPLLLVGVMASAAFAAPADHLIISEVVVMTRSPETTWGSPFIEIVNPTGAAIPMEDVYLTDGTTAPAVFYYNITLLDPASANPGGGVGGDFHARFPAGYSLAAGDTLVIAVNGSTQYQTAYGRNPDFELFEDGSAPDSVPELLEAYQGSIGAGLGGTGNVPVLSDVAESLILYQWDGSSDLVQDIDYVMWGTNTSPRFDKSGVTVGSGTYVADTPVGSQQPAANSGPIFGNALRRTSAEEGTETVIGGNGLTGHDETSENLATTLPTVTGHEPPQANPPFPAGPIFTAEYILSPLEPYEGQSASITVGVVDQDEVEGVVFKYSIDGGAEQTVGASLVGPSDWLATIPAQAKDAVVTWYCVASNTEGVDAIYPAGSPNFAASYTVGEAPVTGDGPAKLLLTEISTTGNDHEFIEIHNPGTEEVDLSDYYLTDAIRVSSTQLYWRIAEPNPTQPTIGGGAYYDFTSRFPDGFTIAAGDTIVVTLPGSDTFSAAFGFDPDLEMYEDGTAPDGIPDMRYIFGDDTNNSIINRTGSEAGQPSTPGLTNGGETVVLYHWVEGEDKVIDIDVFAWKDPDYSSTSYFFSKTGVTIGSHSYLPEQGTAVGTAYGSQATTGVSYHRTDANETGQIMTGSNGVDGRDETSENFANNFDLAEYDPSRPSGGPAPVDPSKLLITQVCAVGTGTEFVEIFNPGTSAVNMAGYYLTDAVYAPGNQYYWQIAQGAPSGATVGGGAFGDWHAKFPAGFTLAAGDTISIAVGGGAAFNTAYGHLPDLKLYEDDVDDDEVPAMEYVFGDASNNSIINRTGTESGQPSTPGLTDAAEIVVLYHWNSGEDKVVDIDLLSWKDPSASGTDFLFSKTGVTVGTHSYNPDTAVGSQTPFDSQTDPGFSYHRLDGNEGSQITSGGNGVGGRDETSENLDVTFDMAAADPARPEPPPNPDDYPPKLLVTEVAVAGTNQEFIEIYNPNDEAVDLSDYYVTDAIHAPNSQYYWRIAQGNLSQGTVGGGAYFDFHARFPDGATVAAKKTIVISVPGSGDFEDAFGFKPDFELFEDGSNPDDVPDMRYLFGDETKNSIIDRTTSDPSDGKPTLTNGGETIILYQWTPGQDRVVDIDVFTWKTPSGGTTFFFNKTGVTIGAHSYLPELGTDESRAYTEAAAFGNSYQRSDASEGSQTPTGSNGVLGRDETSELLPSTFVIEVQDPGYYNPGGEAPDEGETGVFLKVPARTYVPTLDANGFPITFVSNPKDESETRLRVFDLEGRLVVTLFDSRFDGDPPQTTTDRGLPLYWDGRNSTYEKVRAGMYILHLSVTDIRTGDEENFTAPVVLGTRLDK